MANFESYIQEMGWTEKFILKVIRDNNDNVHLKYFRASTHDILSVLGNFDFRYFRKDDPIIKKIENGENITIEDRKMEIAWGLSGENHKHPTLVFPRPMIEVKRIIKNGISGVVHTSSIHDGKIDIQDNRFDDSMNIVLKEIPFEDIFKAMFDRSIIFKFDYTK
jgi:hypothetical protein